MGDAIEIKFEFLDPVAVGDGKGRTKESELALLGDATDMGADDEEVSELFRGVEINDLELTKSGGDIFPSLETLPAVGEDTLAGRINSSG